MLLRNTLERWGNLSIAFHWITALLIIGLLIIGFVMHELPNTPFKREVYLLHKSFGTTVIMITLLRLIWRFQAGAPDPVAGTSVWQHRAAQLAHLALYILLLAMPVSGITYNYASNFKLEWFGITLLDKPGAVDRDLKELAGEAHEILAFVIIGLVAVHATAALWHHYSRKDATLTRMLPWSKRTY